MAFFCDTLASRPGLGPNTPTHAHALPQAH